MIDDLWLSDLVIEALKLEIMRADPWFEQAEVLTLRLESAWPNARALWNELPDDVRAGLRVQAECGAAATTCDAYRACDQDAEPLAPGPRAAPSARKAPPLLIPGG